jgi:hypothetical protein
MTVPVFGQQHSHPGFGQYTGPTGPTEFGGYNIETNANTNDAPPADVVVPAAAAAAAVPAAATKRGRDGDDDDDDDVVVPAAAAPSPTQAIRGTIKAKRRRMNFVGYLEGGSRKRGLKKSKKSRKSSKKYKSRKSRKSRKSKSRRHK